MRMTEAFLYVERVCASLQEKCCVGVTQGVKMRMTGITQALQHKEIAGSTYI